MELKELIKAKARRLGLDAIGIAPAQVPTTQAEGLRHWVRYNSIECLSFVGRTIHKRLNPSAILPGARSMIVAGLGFRPPDLPPRPKGVAVGRVATYAIFQDYHEVLRGVLDLLARYIVEVSGRPVMYRIAVDTSPVMERTMAVQAGLGMICANHMLAHPIIGPAVFLGEIITDLELPPDEQIPSPCLGCGQCLAACPTGAIRSDGLFDATRCINTWTIEHKGAIPPDVAMLIGDRLYGCDDCITVCPLYRRAPACSSPLLQPIIERRWIGLDRVLDMTAEEFECAFSGSAIHRIGLERLKRNARICKAYYDGLRQ